MQINKHLFNFIIIIIFKITPSAYTFSTIEDKRVLFFFMTL